MIKVTPDKFSGSLCEIYSTGFQLAFVSDKLEQCHPWVLCKDFLTDVVWASLHKKPVSIYGFKYNPETNPLPCTSEIRMLVRNKQLSNDKFDKQIEQSLKFINVVERKLKFIPSRIDKVDMGQAHSIWMFTSDKRWIHASPLLSMYSLFLRIGCFYDGDGKLNEAIKQFKMAKETDNQTVDKLRINDITYLKQSRKLRLLILKHGLSIFKPTIVENYPANVDVGTIHNGWGIVNAPGNNVFKTLWDLKELDTIGKKKVPVKKAAE